MFQKVIVCLTGIKTLSTTGTNLLIHLPHVNATLVAVIFFTSFLVFMFKVTSLELLTIDKTSVFS